MDNLTTVLLNKNLSRHIEDVTHQTSTFNYESGKQKVIQTNSMPFMQQKITYTNLSRNEFISLRASFEANWYKPFRLDTDDDIRSELLNNETMNVYQFKPNSFQFKKTAKTNFYQGSIDVVSSVLFNNVNYEALYATTTTYNPSTTTDIEFNALLSELNPFEVGYTYAEGTKRDSKGGNLSVMKSRYLKRVYKLNFVSKSVYFQKFQNFWRKKGNKIGVFGLYEDGFIDSENSYPTNVKVRFSMDSLEYNHTVNKIYYFNMEMTEVL